MTKLSQIKYTKAEVDYTDHTAMKTRCDKCHHFVKPGSCQLVAGKINPSGWCKEFEK